MADRPNDYRNDRLYRRIHKNGFCHRFCSAFGLLSYLCFSSGVQGRCSQVRFSMIAKLKDVSRSWLGKFGAIALAFALLFGLPGTASAQITPPDIGVDAAAVSTALGVALTAIVGVGFGLLVAMIAFKFLWRLAKRGTSG